jgi:hypothetical protein
MNPLCLYNFLFFQGIFALCNCIVTLINGVIIVIHSSTRLLKEGLHSLDNLLYLQIFERIDLQRGGFTPAELSPSPEEVQDRISLTISPFILIRLSFSL